MRDFSDIKEADVAVLPRSNTLFYGSDSSDPRNKTVEFAENLEYMEASQVENFIHIGDYKIEPNGLDNNFPMNFKKLLDRVYLSHGLKRTMINLLLSGGVGLYKPVKEGYRIIKDWQLDNQITDWLESFDFFGSYITEAATDMIYLENTWTMFSLNKGARVGNPKIAKLECLPVEKMRLEYPNAKGVRKNAFYSDWNFNQMDLSLISKIPIFDRNRPFARKNSVMFTKMPTFGSTSYGRPPEIGAIQMLKVLAILPNFHKANLTEKGFKWIVSVSSDYYKMIRERNKWQPTDKKFIEWKERYKDKIDEFLSAPDGDKIQTRFMTEFATDRNTLKTVDTVKLTKLDDDTESISKVGMDLHDTFSAGVASAVSLNPQLANMHLKNHALSGSNLREAFDMHIAVATPTMRNLLLNAANVALKINYPKSGLKLGFMDTAFEDYNPIKTTKKVENNDI